MNPKRRLGVATGLTAFVLTLGCSHGTVEDASFSDASVGDASEQTVDALTEMPDTYAPSDAITPEACNGRNDDGDDAIDEGASVECQRAPHAGQAVCEMGECRCHAAGSPRDGADCNGDWSDGCEVALGTDANCAACGDVCDVASTCRLRDGAYECGAADILDFTLARPGGEIACIVRTDRRVVCRGPNTDFAISDEAPETATLDWTIIPMPDEVTEVRAWQRIREDGRDVLTICGLADQRRIECRGDTGGGLLMGELYFGVYVIPDDPTNHAAAPHFRVDDWSIWRGQGVATTSEAGVPFGIVWGGALAPDAPRSIHGPYQRMEVADQIMTLDATQRAAFGFGPSRDPLAFSPEQDPRRPDELDGGSGGPFGRTTDLACLQDVCCALWPPREEFESGCTLECWGRHPRTEWPATVVVDTPAVTRFRRADMPERALHMAPTPSGRVEVCVNEARRVMCTDAVSAADWTVNPHSPERLHEEPGRFFADAHLRARADWQAMCVQRRPDWWQCWGTHEGWGRE